MEICGALGLAEHRALADRFRRLAETLKPTRSSVLRAAGRNLRAGGAPQRSEAGNAGWQPAVSQIANLRSARRFGTLAGYQPAIQQITNLRYEKPRWPHQ